MMRTLLRPILALALTAACGLGTEANAADVDRVAVRSGYGNSSYGSQMSFDSFNYSIRKRFESVRIGSMSSPLGGYQRSSYNDYGAGAGYNPTPGYNNPNPGYNSSYGSGQGYNPTYNPGYNTNPSAYTPGYNQGYNPGYAPQTQTYNPGYNPQGFSAPATGTYAPPGGGYNTGATYNSGAAAPAYNTYNAGFGANGYSSLGSFSSEGAYAMAPSSRASSVASARRRQLDCVYYSGFTAWADIYQTWARQRSTDGFEEGYEFRTTGPAIGFDWTSGPATIGAAMTYNWGKLSGRDVSHDQKISTWGVSLYGQYNSDNFYVNATLGYGHQRFDSDRRTYWTDSGSSVNAPVTYGDDFTSNLVNIDAEFGWKMAWSGFNVIPNVGLRFLHDRRGAISEGGGYRNAIQISGENYHVLELPIGVNFSYEINTSGMVFVPRGRLAWIPELDHNGGGWSGYVGDAVTGAAEGYGQNAAVRSRHGFQIGLGMEAKITKSLSAHVDYTANLRARQHEHHWNLGMGFSF